LSIANIVVIGIQYLWAGEGRNTLRTCWDKEGIY